ncbi:hypothetical protein PPL_11511 [Heterostelium album PN500]|uniref:Uncharacterized protein n=1 Tax=Heterostelium pallidum (strain ATCC 26659 / Pp 5 / PN500) TaxID=670386 RepID=D3BTL4_HETP5|nr:hypothetical protein PPL_11511 [Heterostelium album PN500]EFA75431.1 hypothetical protein PPL_11511 [Heterostelium album PN500]|eukprot:XP_020427565.1 hypothetical protein PPL_11511 [Heterostelium album PN500]
MSQKFEHIPKISQVQSPVGGVPDGTTYSVTLNGASVPTCHQKTSISCELTGLALGTKDILSMTTRSVSFNYSSTSGVPNETTTYSITINNNLRDTCEIQILPFTLLVSMELYRILAKILVPSIATKVLLDTTSVFNDTATYDASQTTVIITGAVVGSVVFVAVVVSAVLLAKKYHSHRFFRKISLKETYSLPSLH